MKKLKRYEIAVPVKETWYFEVNAFSKEDAIKKYQAHKVEVTQTCSMGGWSVKKLTVKEIK